MYRVFSGKSLCSGRQTFATPSLAAQWAIDSNTAWTLMAGEPKRFTIVHDEHGACGVVTERNEVTFF